MIIQTPQALQQLQANIHNMTDEELRAVQIHIDGRLVFPNLETPRAPKSNPNGRKSYGAVLVFPMGQMSPINSVGMSAIHAITQRFKQIHHSIVPDRNYVKCYKNIQENPTQDSGEPHPEFYQNSWWVNTSSGEKFKPKVFKKINGAITEVLSNDPDLYFGQNVIFVVSLYPTGVGNKPEDKEKRKGTSANLLGILIVGNGERIASKGQTQLDPNAAFGAFAGMTADFSSGSTNMFPDQGSQGQQSNNPFGGNQQQYTPPPSNMGNGQASNPFNQNAAAQGHQGQSNGSQHFNGSPATAQQSPSNPFGGGNNNNNGGNPFNGSLV